MPSRETLDRLLNDFYGAYERYLLSTDSGIAVLKLLDMSSNMQKMLELLTEKVAGSQSDADGAHPHITHELLLVLGISNAPYEIAERAPSHVDVVLTEERSLVPTKVYVCAMSQPLSEINIEKFVDRSRSLQEVSQRVIVLNQDVSRELHEYASRRGVAILSISQLRERLLSGEYRDAIVLGSHACHQLVESYNVGEVYVEPDATPISPTGEAVEPGLEPRAPLAGYLHSFLESADERLLVVLGDYGSGKSAWCAHVAQSFSGRDSAYVPVYIALRHLRTSDELPQVIRRAVRLARQHAGEGKHVLLLADGLDEMPNALSPKERRMNVLRLLESCATPEKLVVTARTSYFRGLDDFWMLFATGEEPTLWDRLAVHIPRHKRRPSVRAIALHTFNNDQIDSYVTELGRSKGDPKFAPTFLREMRLHDPHDFYRRLSRNPLYLFLLVHTEPWRDKSVRSIADVLRLLLTYWLERDMEKGPSRWLLASSDRREFMAALATSMFERGSSSLTFDEFDRFVAKFYEIDDFSRDGSSIALDLQTTGVFGSSGGRLFFALPGFMDLLLAEQLSNRLWDIRHLPSVNQGHLWLALIETGHSGLSVHADSYTVHRYVERVLEWCQENAVEFDPGYEYRIAADATGLIYGVKPSQWSWPRTNRQPQPLVCVLNRVINPPIPEEPNVIRVIVHAKYGLHARPSAVLATAYRRWRGSIPGTTLPQVKIRCKGLEVNPDNIMGVMYLAAEYGTVFHVVYENCTVEEVEKFLQAAGCARIVDAEVEWELLEQQS
ncbi:MAG: HPr family phosphocarrier protein [Gemmatimonadetes bacterium]|nr:HPr family phosphocarrier protein [Gemmatimonadota bacterium]